LRQHGRNAPSWFELAGEFNLSLLSANLAASWTLVLPCGYMAVDWDTTVMNNADTKKEAVGRTYQRGRFHPQRHLSGSLATA
jgi:hypothetical protein